MPTDCRALSTAPCVFAIVLCVAAPLTGAPSSPPITDLLQNSYGSAEGLPQNTVQSLTHTVDGYLWVASQAGKSRFDGIGFRTFQVRNSPGLPQDNIHAVASGRDGSLWVGTYTQGVARFREGVFTPISGLSNLAINAIWEDRSGTVWIGTAHGLNLWQGGKLSSLTTADGWLAIPYCLLRRTIRGGCGSAPMAASACWIMENPRPLPPRKSSPGFRF